MIPQATKVISPAVLTDSMFVSSTAPESDYAAWSAATAYTLAQRCIRPTTHRIYERVIAGTTATAPELDAKNWLDYGPTNQRAMFDDVVGTQTTVAGPLAVVLKPGSISGIGLLELVGRDVAVTLKTATGGTVAYSRAIDLDDTIVQSVYDWMYQPFIQKTSVVLTDLPFHFPSGELTVTVSGTASVSCGVCKFGEVIGIGSSEYGATSGISDYSAKKADDYGRYSIVKRAYSKKMSIKVVTEKSDYNRISRALANLRATPAIWIATDALGYEPLTVYGFYKDFSIDVAYPTMHYCSLDVEGLI